MEREGIKIHELNSSIYFLCSYKTIKGVLCDPNEPTYKIYDSDEVEIASGIPEKAEVGAYFFYWLPIKEGIYVVEFGGKIGVHPVTIRELFEVKKTQPQVC